MFSIILPRFDKQIMYFVHTRSKFRSDTTTNGSLGPRDDIPERGRDIWDYICRIYTIMRSRYMLYIRKRYLSG